MDNLCDFPIPDGKVALKNPNEEGVVDGTLHPRSRRPLIYLGRIGKTRASAGWSFRWEKICQLQREAAELWREHDLPIGTYLLKFSKLEYLRPLLNVGSFCGSLPPATTVTLR